MDSNKTRQDAINSLKESIQRAQEELEKLEEGRSQVNRQERLLEELYAKHVQPLDYLYGALPYDQEGTDSTSFERALARFVATFTEYRHGRRSLTSQELDCIEEILD